MNSEYTDITLVVDRSGSMATMRKDAEGGINYFVKTQKEANTGTSKLTLVQFDDAYEVVFDGVPINEVTDYSLVPRGGTALLDAVGKAIDKTGQRLAALDEKDRPGLVVFVVVTDGQENASKAYTKEKIKEMISHQTDVYKWQFTFLGANQDAFAEGGSLGFQQGGIANYTANTVNLAYSATSDKILRMRCSVTKGGVACNDFTPEEVKKMAAQS